MSQDAWKVGELAERPRDRRSLRYHYDEIGLLRPSGRTAAGHRLYTADDLARLQQIVSLRQLGFTLDEIGGCLEDRPDYDPVDVIRRHAGRLREQADSLRTLCDRLNGLASQLGVTAGAVFARANSFPQPDWDDDRDRELLHARTTRNPEATPRSDG